MYIIAKNKKKIFTNKNKSKKIESILVDVKEVKDEQGSKERLYIYDIFIEVDKREMINKNIKNINVELSSSPLHKSNVRENMLKGVNLSNPKEVHYAVTNARNIRIKTMIANSIDKNLPIKPAGSISSINIFDKSKISKAKKFNLSDNQLFGTKKILKVSRENRSNKKFDSTDNKNILTFDRDKNKRKKGKTFNNPTLFLKRKHKKLSKTGIDMATYVADSLKAKQSQNTVQSLKGRISKIDKSHRSSLKSSLRESISSKFNEGISNNSNIQNSILSMKYEIVPNRNEVVKQRITINENVIANLKSQKLYLIFTAIDEKGTKIDVSEGILKHEEQKNHFNFPTFDFKASATRSINEKIIVKIKNNENVTRSFNVYAKKITKFLPPQLIEYEKIISSIKVPAKSSITLKNKGIFLSRNPVYFRINPVYDNFEYNNSDFCFVNSKGRTSEENYAGITAIVSNDKMIIKVRNIPEDTFRVQIIKRNLTKNETKFKPVLYKTSAGDLKINSGEIGNEIKNNYRFIDDDVELNNIYEYKAKLTSREGITRESSTSFIEKYVKRTGYLNVKATSSIDKKRSKNNLAFHKIDVQIERTETDADKVFKDLFGRFYDLLQDDLKEIKDLNAIIINFMVTLINLDTSEEIHVGDFSVDRDGNASLDVKTESNFDYVIKITPRALPSSEIISKISNNIPFLAKKSRFLPVSSFNTAAIKKVTKNRSRGVFTSVGTKYSDRANRLKGKIIDNKTKLNQTDFDSFYDGNTGDLTYIDIATNNESINNVKTSLKIKNQSIKKIINYKNTIDKNNLIDFSKINFITSFTIIDAKLNIDYLIMSYKINENLVVDGLASNNSKDTSKIINYVYDINEPIGEIIFYCQAVFKDGTSSSIIEIENIVVDTNGDIVNV